MCRILERVGLCRDFDVDVNRYQPSGDLVRCVETESLTSVTHLATVPVRFEWMNCEK